MSGATTDWYRPGATLIEYQKGRTIDNARAYKVAVQVRVPGDGAVFVGWKDTGLDIYLDPFPSFHYDLEGRLSKIAEVNRFWRRGLDNRMLLTERPQNAPPGPTRQKRSVAEGAAKASGSGEVARAPSTADAIGARIREPAERIRTLLATLTEVRAGSIEEIVDFARPDPAAAIEHLIPELERASRFDDVAAAASGELFRSIYKPITILPPDQYRALVLQATEGCAWNKCEFCGFYRDTKFRRRGVDEFTEHVRRVRDFFGAEVDLRTSVFLGQANAVMLPMEDLVPVFEVVAAEFPELTVAPREGATAKLAGIYSFLDAFTTRHKSVDDYARLRELGLRRVYIGMETGCEELLEVLRKPATNAGIAETVHVLEQAGVAVGIILLAGVGGVEFAERHVAQTLEAVRALPLGAADRVFLSELVDYPGATYGDTADDRRITLLPQADVAAQVKTLRHAIAGSFERGKGPKIAPYRVEGFLYT